MTTEANALPIIGRERMNVHRLTEQLHRSVRGNAVTPIRDEDRGSYFEVMLYESKKSTGRVMRVTVTFDRVETVE